GRRPPARSASSARARARAPSASSVMNARSRRSSRALRSRQASVASSAETLRAAIAEASSPRVRSVTRRSGVERRDEIRRLLAEGELAAHALYGAGQGGEVG